MDLPSAHAKTVDYLSDQFKGMTEAFAVALPESEVLICARVVTRIKDGDDKESDLYSHTKINDNEFSRAIYTWAQMLGDSNA